MKNDIIHKQSFCYMKREMLRFAKNDRAIIFTEVDH